MNSNTVSIEEVVCLRDGGGFYQIKGDLTNGGVVAEVMLGEVSPKLYEITRRIISVNLERKRLFCECGREFIINDNLTLIKAGY